MALTLGVLASLPVMLLSGRLVDQWGARPIVVSAGIGMGIAFIGFSLVYDYGTLVALLLVLFAASGVFDVGINAVAIGYEQTTLHRVLTYFHAAFSGGAAFGALAAGVLLYFNVPFRALYLMVVLLLAGMILRVWRRQTLPLQAVLRPGSIKLTRLYRKPAILVLGIISALGMLSESILESWSAIYLRDVLAQPAVLGASGVAGFHIAMLAGRLGAAPAVACLDRCTLLQIAGGTAAGGMLVALISLSAFTVLLGFVIVGLALAIIIPVAFSLGGDSAPGQAGAATAIIGIMGYIGFLVGPALIGGLAEAIGLRKALGAVICSGLAIVILGFWIKKDAGNSFTST